LRLHAGAAVNAIFTAWATGLSASQLVPALPGAILGVPVGVGLYAAVSSGGAVTLGARQPVAPILQSEAA
jgi:hypothetical protein